ncbi:Uncharacterised protein [Salmonella enterica subsp. enterica serovar Typhi]|nr:Uncharacterised protein [Salmonella enterica subsp. enterica serovar Typhi]
MVLSDEIPKSIVRASPLRHFRMWFRLHSVDEVRELDGILDKEDWDVVSD